MKKIKDSIKKNYFHIVGFALLISFLALIIAFAPFAINLKNQVVTSFNGARYGKDIKNFSSSDIKTDDTTINSLSDCGYRVKISNKYVDNLIDPKANTTEKKTNEFASFRLKTNEQTDNPDVQVMCINVNDKLISFKDNVLAAWKDKPELDQQFGMTINEGQKLSTKDFYKLYTKKISKACKADPNYTSVTFINNDLIGTFDKEYNQCTFTFNDTTELKDEFYFFSTDETKPILFVRVINYEAIKKDFLILKN